MLYFAVLSSCCIDSFLDLKQRHFFVLIFNISCCIYSFLDLKQQDLGRIYRLRTCCIDSFLDLKQLAIFCSFVILLYSIFFRLKTTTLIHIINETNLLYILFFLFFLLVV